jgi:DNA invertase Pin-like site-specific DNA recombinase
MRVAIYIRVSTKAQAQKQGLSYQRELLEKMVHARGWELTGCYSDEGISGTKQDRPGLDALMLAARRREIDIVAVWRFDRFARSLSHLILALNEFQALGIQFISHQEGIDTSTPIGRAMFQIVGAMAELELSLNRERVQAAVDAARARGIQLGRPRAKVTAEQARAAIAEHGGVRAAARVLKVAPSLLLRRIKEAQGSQETS